MSTDFGRVFSALRKERGLGQRQVANDLEISQALLSHYENGLREPRLDFIPKICDYYGVSADYLLGRTAARNNYSAMIDNSAEDADGILGATAAVIELTSEDEALSRSVLNYLNGAIYKLAHELELSGKADTDFARESIAQCMMLLAESEIKSANKTKRIGDSGLSESLGAFIENTEEKLNALFARNSAKEKINERPE